MNPLLAEDALKIPSPPATNDPVVWIAIVLVLTVIGLLWWQMKQASIERAAERDHREKSLTGFLSENAAARSAYVEQLRIRDKFEDERDTRMNQRFDHSNLKLESIERMLERSAAD